MDIFDSAFLESVVRAAIPIYLAAAGGLIAERAGVFQIALEGLMLVGAFAAIAGSFWASSWVAGLLLAAAAGALMALVLAYGIVSRGANAIVLGIAFNLLCLGLTGYLLSQLFGVRGTFSDPSIPGLPSISLPLFSEIPIVGSALFSTTVLGILFLLLPIGLWWVLFRTPVGLRLRGEGEHPEASLALGVNPRQYKYWAVVASGVLAGLGGAQLALGNVTLFSEGMTAGRGWIAVVAVMLGRAHPVGVFVTVLGFGMAEALGFRLQGNGLPAQVTEALPYLITLAAVVVFRKHFSKFVDLSSGL